MSAPIENAAQVDDARLYAPPWARSQQPAEDESPAAGSPPIAPLPEGAAHAAPVQKAPPRMPRGGPNIEWAPRVPPRPPRLRFEGDIALKELRHRLSLAPDVVPEPPLWMRQEPPTRWIIRFSFVILAAGVAAFGLTAVSSQNWSRPPAAESGTDGLAAAAPTAAAPEPAARLVIGARRAFANEPLPLGLSLNGTDGGEFLLLKGLASGTRLSAGNSLGPDAWRVPAREVGELFAYAPKDYVGTMDAAVDLRSANDRLVDSHVIRLQWIAKALEARPSVKVWPEKKVLKPVLKLPPEEIAMLLRRGQELLKLGDIAAARLMLRRAAEAGNASAAFALGSTYDPVVLREFGVMGFAPDAAQARTWYQRATALGSTDAAGRMERLGQAGAH
ncbi:MAG: hypothetical protein ACRECO_17815 [Xanthobacteraceae bacterium]